MGESMKQAPRNIPGAGSPVPPASVQTGPERLSADAYAQVRRAFGALLQPSEANVDARALVERMVKIFGSGEVSIDRGPRPLPGTAYET